MSTIFLQPLEQKLLDSGYDSFILQDKNNLISIIANKEGLKYSDITDNYILTYHKQLKTDILSNTCNDTIVAGFTSTNGNTYRLNRDDQINMLGQMEELKNDDTIATVKWKALNLGYVDHTRDDWIQKVFLEALNFKKTNLFKYDDLKTQVSNAQTDGDVLAVAWS
jgi:hypothetical protein